MLACAIALSFTAHIFAVFPFDLKISHELQEEKTRCSLQVCNG